MPETVIDRGRIPARWSVICVFACFIATCSGNLFQAKWGGPNATGWATQIGNWAGFACLLLSFALGLIGIAKGWHARNGETVLIAAIGVFLSTGVLGTMAWMLATLSARQ